MGGFIFIEFYQLDGYVAVPHICHNNKKLNVIGRNIRKSKSGYEADVTVYECDGCQYEPKCTKAKGNKKLYVSKNLYKKDLNPQKI